MQEQRLLSIITINYNNAAGLEKTILSVQSQKQKCFEFIVVDGGSQDGSIDVIKKYEKGIDRWVSEKDNGIYHAMNKGINLAKGEYLFFLNGGDEFIDDRSLEKISGYLHTNDIIYTNIRLIDEGVDFVKKYPEKLNFSFFYRDTLCHQATFIKRSLFEKYGFYDEVLKISSDWKFLMDMICKRNVSYKYCDMALVNYSLDGLSSNPQNLQKLNKERQQVFNESYQAFINDYNRMAEQENLLKRLSKSRAMKVVLSLGFLKFFKTDKVS